MIKTPEAGRAIKAVVQKAGEDTSFEVTCTDPKEPNIRPIN
jgi:hypothetical protein